MSKLILIDEAGGNSLPARHLSQARPEHGKRTDLTPSAQRAWKTKKRYCRETAHQPRHSRLWPRLVKDGFMDRLHRFHMNPLLEKAQKAGGVFEQKVGGLDFQTAPAASA